MLTTKMMWEIYRQRESITEDWLSSAMRPFLTPVVLRWIDERKNLDAVARHMARMGFKVVVFPDGTTQLLRHAQVISELKVQIKAATPY